MWKYFELGGFVMWPLLACSLISLTVILERSWFWLCANVAQDREVIEHIFESLADGGELPQSKSIVGRMLICGIRHRDYSCEKAMENFAEEELYSMGHGMGILDTVITVAPMLGILGTVTGIISSFDMIGQAGIEDPKSVVAGIAEALITTAAGLIISILSVLPYNYFSSKILNAQKTMELYGTRLCIVIDGGKK